MKRLKEVLKEYQAKELQVRIVVRFLMYQYIQRGRNVYIFSAHIFSPTLNAP